MFRHAGNGRSFRGFGRVEGQRQEPFVSRARRVSDEFEFTEVFPLPAYVQAIHRTNLFFCAPTPLLSFPDRAIFQPIIKPVKSASGSCAMNSATLPSGLHTILA